MEGREKPNEGMESSREQMGITVPGAEPGSGGQRIDARGIRRDREKEPET